MVRRNDFQEIVYGIFALIVLGALAKVILKDISIDTGLQGIITIAIIIGLVGAVWAIIQKFLDIIR